MSEFNYVIVRQQTQRDTVGTRYIYKSLLSNQSATDRLLTYQRNSMELNLSYLDCLPPPCSRSFTSAAG